MWEIILWLALFLGSYLVIFFAADLFLDNLKNICEIYQLSPFIIGMLIIGIDPEESIASIIAAFNGLPYISMGNIIGNSIIAMTVPFILPLLFRKLRFKPIASFYFCLLYFLMIIILLGLLPNNFLFLAGLITLGGYVTYLVRNLRYYKKDNIPDLQIIDEKFEVNVSKVIDLNKRSINKKLIFVILGLLFIFMGGHLLVLSAERLIFLLYIPEVIFGFIIMAFITNVEEITLVIKSIQKKSENIGFGGMIGKVIWNLTITFGVSGLIIINIEYNSIITWNWLVLLGIILFFGITSKKGVLERKDGFVLLVFFGIFILINFVYLFI